MISIIGVSSNAKVEFLDGMGNLMVSVSGAEFIVAGRDIKLLSPRKADVCGTEVKLGDNCSEVRFYGYACSVQTTSEDIALTCKNPEKFDAKLAVDGIVSNLSTVSGDVVIHGNVKGPVKTVSGDVSVIGSGDVVIRHE